MPGWHPLSIGYHGDGGLFVEFRKASKKDKVFTSGDYIGVLLDYNKETLIFSKNKKETHKVQLEPHFIKENVYPCVGFRNAIGGIVCLVTAEQGKNISFFSKISSLDKDEL